MMAACFSTCFSIGTKDLGSISKASHIQDTQSQGKALPSYQMSSAPIPTPTWTQAHMEEVREETNVFTETPREPPGLWQVPDQHARRNENFIKRKLSQCTLPKESGRSISDASTSSVSKVTGFWKVRVG